VTIRHKLLVLLAGTAALAGVIIGGGAFPMIRSAVRDRFIERLRSEADLLGGWIAARPEGLDPMRAAHDWGARLDLRVTLIGPDGRVTGDSSVSEGRLGSLENHLSRPEIVDASRRGWGQAYRTSESTGEAFFYLARRVDGGGPVRFVRIALPAWHVRRAESPYFGVILALVGGSFVLLTGLAYFAVRRWSKPLEELAAAARRIAGGELAFRVAPGPDDEVGALAAALERMRGALAAKLGEMEAERRFLDSVIGGMKEGLLLVDPQRRVTLANDTFLQTWAVRLDPVGRPLPEVVRHPQVLAAVESALVEGREIRERVPDTTGTGRAFEMHAARLRTHDAGQQAGVVVLFFDVTRLEALEALRKEFLANVSHELRTPITSIKAAVLTLIEDGRADSETCHRFLETIRRNSERMAVLVEDLTDLSLIETGAIKLEKRPLDLSAIVREVVAQLQPRYTSLGLEVVTDLPSPFTIEADRRRLEQIIVNLVDNAMKFNRRGGTIRIVGRGVDGRAELLVEDTGTGIPSEHLDKIFHRFFRVDPARSQELGGTGLGLAIVKHLVQLHGGTIRAESELGRGSRFVVDFNP
jgi:two-component system phosphate regulon sensor histidine kinase PhoR